MKIIFLTRLFYPHIGGVEKHVEKLSRQLVKKGHKVIVVTTKHDSKLKNEDSLNGIDILRFSQPDIRFIGLLITWMWMLRHFRLFNNADVIHSHDVAIWTLPLLLFFPKHKFYLTTHGWEGDYPIPMINVLLKKLSVRLAHKTLCVGEYIEKYYGIKSDKIIYGSADIPKKVTTKLKRSIVYVGRLEPDTGLPIFLDALKQLNNYRTTVYGSYTIMVDFCGDGILAKICKKYGKVHGIVNPSHFIAQSQVLFASGYLTILEGLANKTLVFCAYDNPLKKDYYVMTPFRDDLVINKSKKNIVNNLETYLANPQLASNKIKRGYNWVKSYSWEKLSVDYLSLWR